MFGSLPRMHRWVLVGVCGISGGLLGAWVSYVAVSRIPQNCADVLLGVCVVSSVNLVPIIAGVGLGLLGALLLVYNPEDPHRPKRTGGDPDPVRTEDSGD
jgi:hypothetical protein